MIKTGCSGGKCALKSQKPINCVDYALTNIFSTSAFLESIKGIGTFVGGRSLEEYILPLMMQALTGTQPEHVTITF
jgi:hypothetical protein